MSRRIYLVLLAIVIVLGLFVDDASALLRYPFAKVTIRVVDYDTGEPIEGAKVRLKLSRIKPQYGSLSYKTEVYGTSDAEGMVTLSGGTKPFVQYLAEHDGYYMGGGRFTFDLKDSPLQFRHTPWNPTLTARLRKKGENVSMYAARVTAIEIPALDKPVGFDLMEADWVTPYGNGKVSDFIFTVTRDYKDESNYSGTLELTFSNKYDGIYAYPIEQNYHSGPPLPYFAPEEGYRNKLMKDIMIKSGKKLHNSFKKQQHYFFRVRSIEKDGKIESALYGKLYHDINFYLTYVLQQNKGKLPSIQFEYYLNPDGKRNTEFKPNGNLLKSFDDIIREARSP